MNRLLQELQDHIVSWADRTFGKQRTPESIVAHLKKEVQELSEKPYDLEEYADVGILWLNAAAKAGYRLNDLTAAMISKHAENVGRKWGSPDKDGICEHVRTINAEEDKR